MIKFILFSMILSSCYTVNQSYAFLEAYGSKIPISKALVSDELNEKQKNKLILLEKVLKYADTEQLSIDNSYKDYIPLKRDAVSYTVSASDSDRFKFKTWWFPFVGTVPYLGFFDENDRDLKARELMDEGFDISKGSVAAFSSLGWFDDPIYSSMLNRSDASFVALILHELIHRTLWISGKPKLNENIAEFGSYLLTKKFLTQNKMNDALVRYENYLSDRKLLKIWLGGLKKELSELYKQRDISKPTVLENKARIIERHQKLYRPKFASNYYYRLVDSNWNNAKILGFSLYSPDMSYFSEIYKKCDKELFGEFLECFDAKYVKD